MCNAPPGTDTARFGTKHCNYNICGTFPAFFTQQRLPITELYLHLTGPDNYSIRSLETSAQNMSS
ncbi:MAG: hypothetical protein PHW84_06260 [Methanosarcina sp.]|nr:hypothetical protein [Methanosarcina sp.]